MREKLQTLSLIQLKEIAKEQGFKGVSNLNKANIIELLVEFSENQNKTVAKNEGGSSEMATRDNSYQRDNYSSQNNYSSPNNYSNQNRNNYNNTQRNNTNQNRTSVYNNAYQN